MTERLSCIPLHEQEYWESVNDEYGLPTGTVYNAQSYRSVQDRGWNLQRLANRAHNISLAQGRVNGQYIQNGNKR